MQHWAIDPEKMIETDKNRKAQQKAVEAILADRVGFWLDLDDTIETFGLIHEAQKMSEAEDASVAYVYNRWMRIKAHLKGLNKDEPWKSRMEGLFTFRPSPTRPSVQLLSIWDGRFRKQVMDIHIFAYHVNPGHVAKKFTDDEQSACMKFIHRYGPDDGDERMDTLQDLFNFKDLKGIFVTQNECWQASENPQFFWRLCKPKCPGLATLAMRIFDTPGNATASERSFSSDSYIHSKIRNRLYPDRANKLEFLYVNAKVLARKQGRKKALKKETWLNMSAEQELLFEDGALGDGDAFVDDLGDTIPLPDNDDEQEAPRKRSCLSIDTQMDEDSVVPPLDMEPSIIPSFTNWDYGPREVYPNTWTRHRNPEPSNGDTSLVDPRLI